MRYILLLTTLLAFQSTADISLASTLEQAAAGNAVAQFKVGKKYSEFANLGYGVSDNKKAMVWLRKAANQGHIKAQYHLAFHYYWGYGVPENYAIALRWFLKASVLGDASSQYQVGRMYALAEGTEADYVKGYVWLSMAKTQEIEGLEIASKMLTNVKDVMSSLDVRKAQALAAQCYESNYKDCD